MKLYGVSTTRNGQIYNGNYDDLAATGFDPGTGLNYHIWYPVEIPSGINSWFNTIQTSSVDLVTTPWTPEIAASGTLEQRANSLTQERLLLIYNDSATVQPQVNVSVVDQQFTGGVVECTEWWSPSRPKIKNYYSFDIKSTSNVNQFPQNMYLQANYSPTLSNTNTSGPNIVINNMQPYSWYVAALRLYIRKDQAIEEDYCVIATQTS